MHRILLLLSAVALLHAESTVGDGPILPANGGGGGDGGADEGARQVAAGPDMSLMWLILAGVIGLMLFTSFRTQRREARRQQELLGGLKVGDRVESIGGIRGLIIRRGEVDIDIRTGGDDGAVLTLALGAVKAAGEALDVRKA